MRLLFALIIYLSGYVMDQFSYPSKWYKRAVLSCIVLSPGFAGSLFDGMVGNAFYTMAAAFYDGNAPLFSIVFQEGIGCCSRNRCIGLGYTICGSYNYRNRCNITTAGYETAIAAKTGGSAYYIRQ